MQIAIIDNEYDLVNSNNELATIYGDNECEIVRTTKDNKYIICYGDNIVKVIDTTNHNVILESDDRVYTSTGMSDMTHALEIYKSFFKTCYYQKIDNHLIEISDSKLLDQVEELKKELSVPGVDKELTAKEILLYQCRELPKIDDIYKTITGNIICQDEQVKAILTAIYNNMLISYMNLDRDEMARLKNNILIYGSTGVGKTAIAQEMAKAFHVPFCIDNMTAAMAVLVLIYYLAVGLKKKNFRFFYHGLSFPGIVMFLIDLLDMVTRPFSLALRLFCNIFVGEILVGVLLGMCAYFLPVPMMLFEVFVALVQALVFMMLTIAYVSMSVNEE